MTELKPCPFCGGEALYGEAIVEGTTTHSYSVICSKCGIGIFKPWTSGDTWEPFTSEKEARKAWNRRPGRHKSPVLERIKRGDGLPPLDTKGGTA
jgi:Lar family restriction alleviation protein